MRSPGAKGLSVARKTAISRRQFLTGAFRGPGAALTGTGAISALPRDLTQGKLGEHYRFGWMEDPQTNRDITAPEAASQITDWEDGIDSVLKEMENRKGIEDF